MALSTKTRIRPRMIRELKNLRTDEYAKKSVDRHRCCRCCRCCRGW